MSYVGCYPRSTVSATVRALFKNLVLESEEKGTVMWAIAGTDQAELRGAGRFHGDGSYLLRSAIKNWESGVLCARSVGVTDDPAAKVYHVSHSEGTFCSTSKRALSLLFPNATIEAWSDDSCD